MAVIYFTLVAIIIIQVIASIAQRTNSNFHIGKLIQILRTSVGFYLGRTLLTVLNYNSYCIIQGILGNRQALVVIVKNII